MKIILGSQSKSRRELMEQIVPEFDTMSADIDEKAIRSDNYKQLPLLLAHAKADALFAGISEPALLITSDQVVIWQDQLREKPETVEEARMFLESYSSHPPQTVTAVVVTDTATGKRTEGVATASVFCHQIPPAIIEQLVEEGNVMSAAGGFRIEDPLFKPYIDHIEGTTDSIMGLPLELTRTLIEKAQA